MKAIYDMMGKCTYPVLKEDAPRQHVETFFQVGMHMEAGQKQKLRERFLFLKCHDGSKECKVKEHFLKGIK